MHFLLVLKVVCKGYTYFIFFLNFFFIYGHVTFSLGMRLGVVFLTFY